MDMTTVNPARDLLMKENQAFRELVQKHQNYEKRLTELANLNYPNEDEQLEELTLKKKKLAIKDEIFMMMQQQSQPAAH